jgi:2-C-methyl-D-erythritol 4-phosphate cytidylyltransferase
MNWAIIIAGGSGRRMGADIPKQFIHVAGKPVLFHTLAAFQNHPMIDAVLVVCIDGWESVVRQYASTLGIGKLREIVPGGATGQESIRNGVFALESRCAPDDIVVVHDGIRPIVERAVLDDVLATAIRHGNGVTSVPYKEQIFIADETDPSTTRRYVPRDAIRCVATPQAYRYGMLLDAYRRAFAGGIGIGPSTYANTLMVDLGHTLHFAAGSDRNIKLTTPADLDVFQTFLARKTDPSPRLDAHEPTP